MTNDDQPHFIRDYNAVHAALQSEFAGDPELAMAKLIGSPTVAEFRRQGDQHVELLRHFGMEDGLSLYDLGCGCGRTASALKRAGWTGKYFGADIQADAVAFLNASCPGFEAAVWADLSLDAESHSVDIVFAWSVFTHLMHEETYIYIEDIARTLKPGGRLVFSFLELEAPTHWAVFDGNVAARKAGVRKQVDMFLHRDQINAWARRNDFDTPTYIHGTDERATSTGMFGQSVVAMKRK